MSGNVSDSFFNPDGVRKNDYVNPFYGIPEQYIPQNIDQMLEWSNLFLRRFGFYRSALSRIANYFITQVSVDCEDEESKEEYLEIFDKLHWKEHLAEAGMNLLAHGNSCVSINQGFNRFLICPQCNKVSLIDRVHNFKFEKGKYTYQCPSCQFHGVHKVIDKPNKDINNIHIKHWSPREIKILHESTTGKSAYFWQIPQDEKNKVTRKGDKFFPKYTPKVVYDSIYENKMVEFNRKNFLHLKVPTPAALKTDGKAIPPCIYMFDNFFMLKVLERFNEVICFEDIVPFRVIAMDPGTGGNNPILGNTNAGSWAAAVDDMIQNHRRDPGSYQKFPFPITYQQLSGEGKNLAPVELMQMAQNNILNALNIPQEMYTMTLQTQAVGPALRLFENSWSTVVDNYNRLLQHWGDVIAKIRGLAPAKFKLIASTLADDMEKKSVIGQLAGANAIARQEILSIYNMDYKDQLRKKMQEDIIAQELQEEEAEKQQIKAVQKASIFNQQGGQMGGAMMGAPGGAGASPGDSVGSGHGSTPGDVLQQATEIADQLFPMDGSQRRAELQKIKGQNETLWSAIKGKLQQMDGESKSQGHQANKQSMQQQ